MSQFYFATLTSTTNMVTLATLLTATTFKTEAIRQMKRKPDQLQSKINRQFFEQQLITWLERKENVSPTTFKIQNRWRFLQNSTLNLQLYKNTNQKKKTLNKALIRENQWRKKIWRNEEILQFNIKQHFVIR